MEDPKRKPQFIDGEVVFQATCRPEQDSIGPVKFKYRPLESKKMAKFQNDMQGAPANVLITGQRLVATQVTEWDVVDSRGEKVEINESNAARLEHHVLTGMVELIMDSANEGEEALGN